MALLKFEHEIAHAVFCFASHKVVLILAEFTLRTAIEREVVKVWLARLAIDCNSLLPYFLLLHFIEFFAVVALELGPELGQGRFPVLSCRLWLLRDRLGYCLVISSPV